MLTYMFVILSHIVPVIELVAQTAHIGLDLLVQLMFLWLTNEIRDDAHMLAKLLLLRFGPFSKICC